MHSVLSNNKWVCQFSHAVVHKQCLLSLRKARHQDICLGCGPSDRVNLHILWRAVGSQEALNGISMAVPCDDHTSLTMQRQERDEVNIDGVLANDGLGPRAR